MPSALIVEDDPMCRDAIKALVGRQGFDVTIVETLEDARKAIASSIPDLALVDLGLPDGDGLRLVDQLANIGNPPPNVVVVTGELGVETAVEAMRLGAREYLTKPIDVGKLKGLLENIASGETEKQTNPDSASLNSPSKKTPHKNSGSTESDLFYQSPTMTEIAETVKRVARTNVSVLIVGESGTGKEVIARSLHNNSLRASHPFVPVNSGAISPNLIESQLFGHEKGSFTGASASHKGYFEQAEGGTLFLDEITEMPMDLQIKLLRVLETRQIKRVGATEFIDIDVRILAATNRNPKEAVSEGTLRHDLYFRLNVFPINMPPLRNRLEEVEGLTQLFTEKLNKQYGTTKSFDSAAIEKMRGWRWPGNVRELKNFVERAYIMAGETVTEKLVERLLIDPLEDHDRDITPFVGCTLKEVEHRLIIATMEANGGDKPKSAEMLGFSLKTLYNRLNEISEEKAAEESSD